MASYDRYSKFRNDGSITKVPFIKIDKKNTDKYEIYQQGITRLDLLSYKYYDNANYDWLIMMANSEYGSMEFSIPNNVQIRIPYPLSTSLEQYRNGIDKYIDLYGLE